MRKIKTWVGRERERERGVPEKRKESLRNCLIKELKIT
jgi:hypothetical protein